MGRRGTRTGDCPHCGREIEVASAGDLQDKFGITPMALQHAREKGKFPQAWITFGNRNVWLLADVKRYAEDRARKRVEQTVGQLRESLFSLPEEERKQAIALLSEDGEG